MTPLSQPLLLGHEDTLSHIIHSYTQGKLGHALMLSGDEGTGKATLAIHIIRRLLAGDIHTPMDAEHPIFRRLTAGSHGDFLLIRPEMDTKREEIKQEISVEQVRSITEFVSTTPSESDWRIILVDGAELMTLSAANAILKVLEEPPPHALFFLISHQPESVLPTIRSRCQIWRCRQPSTEIYTRILSTLIPELSSEEIKQLATLSNGSAGRALRMHEQNALEVYDRILSWLYAVPDITKHNTVLKPLLASLTGQGKHTYWGLLASLTLTALSRAQLMREDMCSDFITEKEERTLRHLSDSFPGKRLSELWFNVREQFFLARTQHLEYGSVLLTLFDETPIQSDAA